MNSSKLQLSDLDLSDPHTLHTLRRKCETDFYFFVKFFFRINRKQSYQDKTFLIQIARKLQDVALGKCKRLIINIPPRFGKTELAVINWIAWCLANNPQAKFIHTSYSKNLALDNASKVKELITDHIYHTLWGLEYKEDSKAKEKWYTTHGGGMYSASSDGQITGFGAGDIQASAFSGAIIIDDPLKAGDEISDIKKATVIDKFYGTILNRLNNEDVPIIIIMQRLHEDDLSGYLMHYEPENWEHIKIPALDEDEKSIWEERFSTSMLKNLRRKRPKIFAGQYMQEPAPTEGNIININWFNYYQNAISGGKIYQSWDTANKDGEENDYSVCITWCVKDNQYYIIDIYKDKLQFPELIAAMKRKYEAYQPYQIIIEDKASGQQSLQVLRKSTNLPIVAYNPMQRSKSERMVDASPHVESGRVHLKSKAAWLDEFLHEIKLFPNGRYKDTGDAFSMFINWFSNQRRSYKNSVVDVDF